MNKQMIGIVSAGLFLAVAGCSKTPEQMTSVPDAPGAAIAPGPGVTPPAATDTTAPAAVTAETWVDKVALGGTIAQNGAVEDKKDEFSQGDGVHLSMQVDDAPPATTVTVHWYGPHNKDLGEQTKPVIEGTEYLSFTKDSTKWTRGDYRAEVWVGDEKVEEESFKIVAKKA